MPILRLQMTCDKLESQSDLAQRVANVSAQIFGAQRGSVWVLVEHLAGYAENDVALSESPVLVSVLLKQHAEPSALEGIAARLSVAIADVCGISCERTHIVFEPPGLGRVFFGGRAR